jgi:hypothetical protein
MQQYVTRAGFLRATTTIYTTKVDREVTSTVFVTAAAQPALTGVSSDSLIVYSPVPEVSASVESSAEGSMVVQTTGVSQGTPSFPDPSATEDTSPAQPDPTAPPFTCPEDNGMTISQMLSSERFDYDIFCDTAIGSESIPIDLSYETFSECVAACSLANAQFAQPVCQGAAFLETTGNNCFLKSAANASDTVAAIRADLAILKRVAVGVSPENNAGTSTEPVVFSVETPTMDPSEVGSLIVGMMGNSTSTVPMVVPDVTPPPSPILGGRPALDGITAYSTFVSNGETVSTGMAYSSYFSNASDGSWFYTYYSEWSLAWTDVQTIYGSGASATGVPVAANDEGTVVEFDGSNGGYTTVTNSSTTTWSNKGNETVATTTELIGTNEYDANGTLTYATTVTNFYTYTSAALNGSGGRSGGGIEGSGAGVVTSTGVSSFSTQTVIYSSGGTGGSLGGQGSGGQVIQTPGPVIPSGSAFSTQSVNTISGGAGGSQGGQGGGGAGNITLVGSVTSTFTSASSTQTVIVSSGNAAGGGGGEGGGALGSTLPIAGGSSVIFISGGTAFSTGGVVSGAVSIINGTSGATSAIGSGAVVTGNPTTSNFTELSVILISDGTGGVFNTGGQGQGVGTGSPSVITSVESIRGSFSNTGTLRTPKPGDSDYIPPTGVSSGPAPYPPAATTSGSLPALNVSIPISTGASFTNSQTLRTGGFSTSSGTAFSSGASGSSILTFNASLPIATATLPGSFTKSQTLRTGLQTTSPGGPVPYPPFSTAPAPSGSIPSLNVSLPIPTGMAPLPPLSTGPSGVIPLMNASLPVGTGTAPPIIQTLSLPTGNGSTPGSFSNTDRPRSGTLSTGASSATSRPMVIQTISAPSQGFTLRPSSSTRGASMALSTGASYNGTIPPFPTGSVPPATSSNGTIPPFPTGTAPPATSCPPMSVSTTTLYATTTELGCYDFCPPSHGGLYGPDGGSPGGGSYGGGNPNPKAGDDQYRGPQSFGPPAAIFAPTLVGNPNPEPTEPTSPA